MKTQIKNGRLINPASNTDAITDIFIDNQLIVAVGKQPDGFAAEKVIDASNKVVIPGIIDVQCRVRQPGFTHKANISSETNAAAKNGITSICVPPDSNPVNDNAAVVELIHHTNQKAGLRCHIYTIGALTINLAGETLSNMGTLKKSGCIALSNCLQPFLNNLVQRRAMEYAAGQNIPVIIQPYDHALYADGCAHEGIISTRLGLPPIPVSAETAALAKDIELVAQSQAQTHFGQLSCARSVEMIRQAKAQGLPITADVSLHQLMLTERDIDYFDSYKSTIPPLRSEQDRQALIEGVRDGTIDCICSDHQPHNTDAKLKPFPSAEPGISTLDTFLPLLFKFSEQENINLTKVIAAASFNPAKVFRLPSGQIAPGELADIVIVDDQCHFTCDAKDFLSAGKNTAFQGWDFTAKAVTTLVAGKLID